GYYGLPLAGQPGGACLSIPVHCCASSPESPASSAFEELLRPASIGAAGGTTTLRSCAVGPPVPLGAASLSNHQEPGAPRQRCDDAPNGTERRPSCALMPV